MSRATDRPVREKIVETYARWTVLSALRSGSPIKSRKDVYPLLGRPDFEPLFDRSLGAVSRETFDAWHRAAVRALIRREARLNVGWAAKMVNVYLKTRGYIGREGRHHLIDWIHPPLDAGLWQGIRERFSDRPDILKDTHSTTTIRGIQDYAAYSRIISGCRVVARLLNCRLIEVDQLWQGVPAAKT